MTHATGPERAEGKGSRAGSDASWALALGAAALLLCAPVTAPIAIWKATVALRMGQSELPAVAGIGLALVGLASSAFFWFLAIWQYLSP